MSKSKKKKAFSIGKAAVIIGVLVIPLLYSYFYLEAFWDPYARLDSVPVAVVNLDKGATINGKTRNVGEEICDNLKEDGSLKFDFTDADTAKDGVLNQKYYASITIPADFSSNISTASENTEKLHSKIIYSANQKKNYLAAQILENAMPTIKDTVNSSIDKEIIQTLSDKLNSVPDQMGELQDGLNQLYDGSSTLKDGTKKLDSGATDLKDGSKTLSDGASQVSDGSTQLDSGISRLKNGTDTLSAAAPTLAQGVSVLNLGASKLSNGAASLKSGVSEYTSNVSKASAGSATVQQGILAYTTNAATASQGASDLYKGVKKVSGGVDLITSNVKDSISKLNDTASEKKLKQLESGSAKVSDGLKNLDSAYDTSMADIKQALIAYGKTGNEQYLAAAEKGIDTISKNITALSSGAGEVNDGVTLVTEGLRTVKSETQTLYAGLQQAQAGFGTEKKKDTVLYGAYNLSAGLSVLTSNNDTLNTGAATLSAGLGQLAANNNALNSGASQVADGASQLSAGTNTLNANVPTLMSGIGQLANGATQLKTGSTALSSGASQVADGAVDLFNGIVTLKNGTSSLDSGAQELKDGVKTAKDGVDDSVADTNEQLKALDGLADYVGDEPVTTETEYVQPVENYGSAFAPYFMCLSLWVGGLMIFFGIYLDYKRKIPSLSKDSKYPVRRGLAFIGISAAQGIALALIIKFALGIVVNNFALLIASCILVSLTFMAIIQFFLMFTGNIGKFVALFLLILQLTSCAGTFPIETQSNFFIVINKFLPMTYSTQLFKEAISGTAGSWAGKNALVLIAFLAVFVIITAIGMVIEKKKSQSAPQSIEA